MKPTEIIAYDFFSPTRIVFGWGRRQELGQLTAVLGRRAFIIWGSRKLKEHEMAAEMLHSLSAAQVETVELTTVAREPLVADVDAIASQLVGFNAKFEDVLIPIGGGSAIDLAKGAAALATNRESGTVKDYLEGVGRGFQLRNRPLSILAVPTTAGTGSEVTKNAVISSSEPPFKKSLRSEQLIPRVAIVDPELTVTCPPAITAQSGMDAITQCIESHLSRKAKPIASALAIQGLRLAMPAIAEAVRNGTCRPARESMAQAAFVSGMALANSGLGMAHGVAAALGTECKVPHGLACAVMLPIALRANSKVSIERLAELEFALSNEPREANEAAERFIERIDQLNRELEIPATLRQLNVTPAEIRRIVAGSRGNSMDGNPRMLSDAELTRILEGAL
jgi:alcohol dehydrogenase class IV